MYFLYFISFNEEIKINLKKEIKPNSCENLKICQKNIIHKETCNVKRFDFYFFMGRNETD